MFIVRYEQSLSSIRINFVIPTPETGCLKQHSQGKSNFNFSWKSKLSVSYFLCPSLTPELLRSYVIPLIPQMPLHTHGKF